MIRSLSISYSTNKPFQAKKTKRLDLLYTFFCCWRSQFGCGRFLQFVVQHNVDYVMTAIFVAVFLYDQPHIFHTLPVFIAGIHNINAGGVDTAVTENVGELGNILFNAVKSAGKQMA